MQVQHSLIRSESWYALGRHARQPPGTTLNWTGQSTPPSSRHQLHTRSVTSRLHGPASPAEPMAGGDGAVVRCCGDAMGEGVSKQDLSEKHEGSVTKAAISAIRPQVVSLEQLMESTTSS